jgi:hypothetical protein
MIELAFGESAAGALKAAQHRSLMVSEPHLVLVMTLYPEIGEIAPLEDSLDLRQTVLESLFADFPGVAAEIWQSNLATFARLQAACSTSEPVRVWICAGNPMEICSLYFLCDWLKDSPCPLSVVQIPQPIEREDHLVEVHGVGEIVPSEFASLLKYETPLDAVKRTLYTYLWALLSQENAPLRVVLNGSVISVPADFYDFSLRANFPDQEVRVAQVIGRTLNQTPGANDRWLYLRLQAMIQAGEIIEVSAPTNDSPYSGILQRKY